MFYRAMESFFFFNTFRGKEEEEEIPRSAEKF